MQVQRVQDPSRVEGQNAVWGGVVDKSLGSEVCHLRSFLTGYMPAVLNQNLKPLKSISCNILVQR